MEGFVEWTFEGGPKGNHLVGVTGNRARYQFGMYDIVRERVDICQFEWYRDNKILDFVSRLRKEILIVFKSNYSKNAVICI